MSKLPVKIITPHDGMDAFRDAFAGLATNRRLTCELAWRMFVRDTRATFRGSFLGWFWIIVPTLANSLVWMFLSGSNVIQIETGSVPYPVFVFTGNLLWTAFNSCLVGGLGILNEAQGTLGKVWFPHETLVLVVLLKSLLTVCVTALGLPVFLLLYPVTLQPSMLLFPVGVLATMLCGLSLGLITVPVAALFSDISRAINLGLRFVFFLTPVIFPLPAAGLARRLMLWNPATSLIVASRAWLLGGESADLGSVSIVASGSALLLVLGVLTLKVAMPHIIERMSGT